MAAGPFPASVERDDVIAAVTIDVRDLDRLGDVVARGHDRSTERSRARVREHGDTRGRAVPAEADHDVLATVTGHVADSDAARIRVRRDAILGRRTETAAHEITNTDAV